MTIVHDEYTPPIGTTTEGTIYFRSPYDRDTSGKTLTTKQSEQPLTNSAFSVDLPPGPLRAKLDITGTTNRAKWWDIEVPDTGPVRLLDLIAIGVNIPPQTTIEKFEAAVVRLVEGGSTDLLTQTDAAAAYAPRWQASTTYAAGSAVLLPNGTSGTRTATGTSRPTFDSTELAAWTVITGEISDEAVADAVTAELAGRDVIEGDDPRLPEVDEDAEVHWGLRDSSGREQMVAKSDGTVEIPLPTVAGMEVREEGSPNDYDGGLRDPAGRVSGLVTKSGQVPDWVLERWGDRQGWAPAPTPDKPRVHILITAGQSNGEIADASYPTGTWEPDPRLLQYNRTTGLIEPMSAINDYLLPSAARAYIRQMPPDVTVLIVPCAMGSTAFTYTTINPSPDADHVYNAAYAGTWDRLLTADPVNLALRMNADVTAARNAAVAYSSNTPQVKAVFWSHGEGDSPRMTGALCGAKLDDLISWFRTAQGLSTLPFIIGSMVPEYVATSANTYVNETQDALMDTPRRVLNTAYSFGPEGMHRPESGQTIHYSVHGNVVRGHRFVEAIRRAKGNNTNQKPSAPTGLVAKRSGTALTVTYEPPWARHTVITPEFSVDGGSTWAAMTKVGGAIGLKATATITTTDAIKVRVSATNDFGVSGYVTTEL